MKLNKILAEVFKGHPNFNNLYLRLICRNGSDPGVTGSLKFKHNKKKSFFSAYHGGYGLAASSTVQLTSPHFFPSRWKTTDLCVKKGLEPLRTALIHLYLGTIDSPGTLAQELLLLWALVFF